MDRASNAKQTALSITFAECAEQYIRQNSPGWKNPKHVALWRTSLRDYAFPVIGKLPIGEVTNQLVLRIVGPIWETKTPTAKKVCERISAVWGWARVQGFCAGENPAKWRDNLQHLLPKPSNVSPTRHHPALDWRKIPAFVKRLLSIKGVARFAVEFTVLTACRTQETIGATWDEIDLKERVWTIKAERRKGRRQEPHIIPLSARAVEILKEVAQKISRLPAMARCLSVSTATIKRR